MRCPKCSYITFDSGDRCRNCGYEFSFTQTPTPELPIQTGDEPEGPLADFSLEQLDEPTPGTATESSAESIVPDPTPAGPITSSFDLPLFGGRNDDRPLVSAPAVPRPPLSVRKAAPLVQRQAPRRGIGDTPRLDLAPEEPEAIEHVRPAPPANAKTHADAAADSDRQIAATAPARAAAALIDAVLLGAINLAVLHFTLKLCDLTYADLAIIPPAPFLAFLLLLNGGYATAFTAAGGQSIGKMVAHIKVVPSDVDAWTDRVPLGQAVFRAAGYLLSALPLGLGFLPALFGTEKRAIHDRLAHTRVVKV